MAVSTGTKKTTTKKKTEEVSMSENDVLKAQIEAMQKMISELSNKLDAKEEPSPVTQRQYYSEPITDIIPPNKQIKVMSLCYGILNLSSDGYGGGKVHTFQKFGQVKNILYSDLMDIIVAHDSFLKSGKFIILDEDVIKFNGLEEDTADILTADVLGKILEFEDKEIEVFLEKCPSQQIDMMARMILDMMMKDEYVDLNKVKLISNKYGKDLYRLAEDGKIK